MEPSVEPVRVAQGRQVSPSLDQGLLGRVSGELSVAEDEPGRRVQARDGRAGKDGEGVMIAPLRSLDVTSLVHSRPLPGRGPSGRAQMVCRRTCANRSRRRQSDDVCPRDESAARAASTKDPAGDVEAPRYADALSLSVSVHGPDLILQMRVGGAPAPRGSEARIHLFKVDLVDDGSEDYWASLESRSDGSFHPVLFAIDGS